MYPLQVALFFRAQWYYTGRIKNFEEEETPFPLSTKLELEEISFTEIELMFTVDVVLIKASLFEHEFELKFESSKFELIFRKYDVKFTPEKYGEECERRLRSFQDVATSFLPSSSILLRSKIVILSISLLLPLDRFH